MVLLFRGVRFSRYKVSQEKIFKGNVSIIKVAHAICGQILNYQMSIFTADIDQLYKYGFASVTVLRLCYVIL